MAFWERDEAFSWQNSVYQHGLEVAAEKCLAMHLRTLYLLRSHHMH